MKTRTYVLFPVLLQTVIYVATRIIFVVFARLKIEGIENINNLKGAVIFAPNHQSEWDGPLVRTCLPLFSRERSPMYFVGMKNNGYGWQDFGWRSIIYRGELFKMLGSYPTYPGKGNYSLSLKDHIALLNQGKDVCIFPEGKRSFDGTLGEVHGGVAFLSHYTKSPVVPVAIIGLHTLRIRDLFLRRRRVIVRFGKPIFPKKHPPIHPEQARVDYRSEAQTMFNEVKKILKE